MNAIEQITSNCGFVTEERYNQTIKPLRDLAVLRGEKYGNSIAIVDDVSVVDLVLMKLCRTKTMIKRAEQKQTKLEFKCYDEIGDCINYLVYFLRRKADQEDLPVQQNKAINNEENK